MRRDKRMARHMHKCYTKCLEAHVSLGLSLPPGKAYILGFRAGAEYGKHRAQRLLSQPSLGFQSDAGKQSETPEGTAQGGDTGELSAGRLGSTTGIKDASNKAVGLQAPDRYSIINHKEPAGETPVHMYAGKLGKLRCPYCMNWNPTYEKVTNDWKYVTCEACKRRKGEQ